jgi:membrane-associated progesterone receptor component
VNTRASLATSRFGLRVRQLDGRASFRFVIFENSESQYFNVAVKGKIYDVSAKSSFYGPGAGYHVFAGLHARCGDSTCISPGRDATRGLALTSLDVKDVDNSSIAELTDLSTLNEWIASYESKYDVIGWVGTAAGT